MNLDLRKWIVKCLVWSEALYAAETRTISKTDMKRIEAFEMWIMDNWIWRKTEKISWTAKVSNSGKRRWLGHVLRHDVLLWDVLEGRMRQVTYERQKETTADEQHMPGIRNSKETSWRQMSVMCLSDGSHWPATTAEYQKKRRRIILWSNKNVTLLLHESSTHPSVSPSVCDTELP